MQKKDSGTKKKKFSEKSKKTVGKLGSVKTGGGRKNRGKRGRMKKRVCQRVLETKTGLRRKGFFWKKNTKEKTKKRKVG